MVGKSNGILQALHLCKHPPVSAYSYFLRTHTTMNASV